MVSARVIAQTNVHAKAPPREARQPPKAAGAEGAATAERSEARRPSEARYYPMVAADEVRLDQARSDSAAAWSTIACSLPST